MSPHTRQAIKNYLEGFIEGVIDAFVTQDLDPRELRPPRQGTVPRSDAKAPPDIRHPARGAASGKDILRHGV